MPLSAAAAPFLHALVTLLLLGATASVTAAGGGVHPSMRFTNGTEQTSPNAAADTERYICYLCTGRNALLIRYCPIYWDECHLECYADQASATAIPAAPVPTATSLGPAASAANPSGVHDDECYVMKLYRNGSYTIVTRLGCAGIARCLLSCGSGDMADTDSGRNALGTGAAAATATTAAVQASLTPRLADFQRCGTQVTAAPSLRGAVVRAGGARRRR